MITQPLPILQCNHAGSAGCVNEGAGHETRPVHVRVAEATPSKWADGIVLRATSDGWIGIALFGQGDSPESDAATVWVWNHADLTAHLSAGGPVALHSVYNVLASGRSRVSVVRL